MQIVNVSTVLNRAGPRNAPARLDAIFGAGRWRYVGWGNRRLGLVTSPLANPYTHQQRHRAGRLFVGSREEAVERYRQWLWARIEAGDEPVLAALRELDEESVLICWCAPKRCHASVIERAARWLRGQKA
jgi:hypothetical protein